jgi:hypothetical protein
VRRRVLTAALVLALVLVSAAVARDPRLEQVRLKPADVALAKRITVRLADLPAGSRKQAYPNSSSEPMRCAEVNPDLSSFTITGKAKSAFTAGQTTQVLSNVEVYESAGDASADFRLTAKPALAKCLRREMESELATGGLPIRIVSAKVVPAPRVGDRRIAYRVVATATSPGAKANVYADLVAFQRGRSITLLTFMSVFNPFPRIAQTSTAVASRMR